MDTPLPAPVDSESGQLVDRVDSDTVTVVTPPCVTAAVAAGVSRLDVVLVVFSHPLTSTGGFMSNRRLPSPNAPGGSLGDIIDDLRDEGHLSPRQLRAAHSFLASLRASHGCSAGLVADVKEKIDTSRREALRPPGGSSIAPLDQRLHRLRPHERELLKFLVTAREKPKGCLTDYGRPRSAYQTSRTVRAFAIGRLTGLLESLADEFVGPVKMEIPNG